MTRTLRAFLALAIACCTPGLSHAQPGFLSTGDWLAKYDASPEGAKAVYQILMKGEVDGFSWSNTYLQAVRKAAPLYCPPPDLVVGPVEAITILRNWSEKSDATHTSSDRKKLQWQPALLFALQEAFPCPGK
jgi:hypothetical protein